MCISRWQLRSLSLYEMVFSLNPTRSEAGIYRYLHHPMYVGIAFLLCGSFILYPTIPGIFIFSGIGFLLYKKIGLEEK